MKNILYTLMLVFPLLVLGQSTDQNYVKSTTYKQATQITTGIPATDKIEKIVYYDGLGRPLQTIAHRSGGNGKDIINHLEYDTMGRLSKTYLPYVENNATGTISLAYRTNALPETNSFYQTNYATDIDATPNPFSEIEYDVSPLNRVLQQAAPGKDWKLNSGNTIKFDYQTNNALDLIKYYEVSFANGNIEKPQLILNGTYPINTLYKNIIKDENWTTSDGLNKTTEEFNDKSGNIILKRTYEGGQKHDTQYVYDVYGNLTYVLSPEAENINFVDVGYPSFTQNVTNNIVIGAGLVFNPDPIGVYGYTGSVILSLSNSNQLNIAVDLTFQTENYILKMGDIVQAAEALPDVSIGGNLTRTYKISSGYLNLSRKRQAPFPAGSSLVENYTITLPPNMQLDTEVLNNYCYQYKYDKDSRLIAKKIPGKQWESIVYDKLDRPVLIQDENLKNQGKWMFTTYESFNRVAYTGLYTSDLSRHEIQNELDNQTVFNENKLNGLQSNLVIEYTNNVYPTDINNIELLTVNFYDDYNFGGFGITPITGSVLGAQITNNVKGLNTGSKIKVLETNNWIYTISQYDEKARLIYNVSKNEYLNTYETLKNQYDFIGNLIKSEGFHTDCPPGTPCPIGNYTSITTINDFTYDHQNRLLTHIQKTGGNTPELIASNVYDDLGTLITKKVGNTLVQPLQNVNYKYNIRGWLKEINDPNSLGDDLFAFKLNYNDVEGALATTTDKLYNGNIAQTIWKSATDNVKRSYAYSYDDLNRLKSAFSKKDATLSSNMGFNVNDVIYDRNGNITDLKRFDLTTVIDELHYDYEGNQLGKVTDNSANIEGFKDGTNTGDDYDYDVNGNITEDKNKNITEITYNHLNLPVKITFGDNNPSVSGAGVVEYTYDAFGSKLKKFTKVAAYSAGSNTFYSGDYIYKQDPGQAYKSIVFINQPEGYKEEYSVTVTTGTFPFTFTSVQKRYRYVYQYKDHLGNIRLSYADDNADGVILNEIRQNKAYYPFGLKHKGYNNVITGREHPYGYNGKEEMDDLNLGMMDYGARFYDPAVGRWFTPDALAEQYYSDTTYGYGLENPIIYIDPDGNEVEMCCQELKGFLVGMADNTFGTNMRGSWKTSNPAAFASGVNAADVTSVAAGSFMMMHGTHTGAAGGMLLAGSLELTAASGGLAIEVTGPGAAIGGTMMASGAIEATWGSQLATNGAKNLGNGSSKGSSASKKTEKASDLPTTKTNSPEWNKASSDLTNLLKEKKNVRVGTLKDAKSLLKDSRGNMNRYKQYVKDKGVTYKKGYEVHNQKNARELGAGNDLPHLKWKDGKSGGHIYYNKQN